MCNVVVLIEKVGNCQNDRILKIYEDLEHFRINVHFIQGNSSVRFQILYNDFTDIENVQRRSFG